MGLVFWPAWLVGLISSHASGLEIGLGFEYSMGKRLRASLEVWLWCGGVWVVCVIFGVMCGGKLMGMCVVVCVGMCVGVWA